VDAGLLRDSDWEPLEGQLCRVIEFRPLAGRMKGQKVKSSKKTLPYAAIDLESPALAELTTGFITHKLDFQHLWEAFNVRGVGDDEEVHVMWNKSNLNRAGKLLPRSMMPGLIVWIRPRGAYELLAEETVRPELDWRALDEATAPIVEWIPQVME
jgi:hypothetical protein